MVKSGSLVVKPHSRKRRWLTALGALVVLPAMGAGLYYLGSQQAGYDRLLVAQERAAMEARIQELELERDRLRDRVALLERSSQMDREAYDKLDQTLKGLQAELLELREEVAFYRGIVSPRQASAGLRVERFRVEPQAGSGEGPRLYHYNLVLTQVLKNDRTARGVVMVTVEGVQDGRPTAYALHRLTPDTKDKKKLPFRFRYFQKFEGDLILPAGFTPRTVKVEVRPRRGKAFVESFPWPAQPPAKAVEAKP